LKEVIHYQHTAAINEGNEMNAQHNGRTYQITKDERAMPNLMADLIKRGFDGHTYYGSAPKTGRQRADFFAIFYRTTCGKFVAAI
jgi:hypothetical protein